VNGDVITSFGSPWNDAEYRRTIQMDRRAKPGWRARAVAQGCAFGAIPGAFEKRRNKRHSGAHFLWFVSLLRNKEMNPACCAAADGKKFLSKNVKPYQRM
jgi:hypothetical protein